jgi:GAF domain-containing protein
LDYSDQLASCALLDEAAQLTFQYLRALTPSTACAIFRYDQDRDSITCVASGGDPDRLLIGLTIKHGKRISGWSIANDSTVTNSHAVLDLDELGWSFYPPLRSALATPLKSRGRFLGTLTVYSSRENPFSDDHGYAVERIATGLAERLDMLFIAARPGPSLLRFRVADKS